VAEDGESETCGKAEQRRMHRCMTGGSARVRLDSLSGRVPGNEAGLHACWVMSVTLSLPPAWPSSESIYGDRSLRGHSRSLQG